jgi:lysyl-tRNA synthetase, class II
MSNADDTHLRAYQERFDNQVLQERLEKVEALRGTSSPPFANGFVPSDEAAGLFADHADADAPTLEATAVPVSVAGRIRFFRRMGKACFVKIQDRSCRPGVKPAFGDTEPTDDYLQLFISKAEVGDEAFERIIALDLGDIVGATGTLMRTRTGELSLKVAEFHLLTKSSRPLPEKFKGLTDVEQRFRQRYVDLVMNEEAREVFFTRTRALRYIRRFLEDRGYLEVETPMMHVTPGGATARPFTTHHNALDMELYLRIAPELYLKRLLVGGLERVFELSRSFRNEGVSRQHNPEFTMLEFYCAYATHEDLIALTEEMIVGLIGELHGQRDDALQTTYQGIALDWTRPWRRVSVADAVAAKTGLSAEQVWDPGTLGPHAAALGIDAAGMDAGKLLFAVFEAACEDDLVQPTFLVDFPAAVSPLARRKDDDPRLVDRFEIYVAGREIGNGFSELNDPADQYVRFAQQLEAREAGDDEAMAMDDDYIRALEYGMPPAAGEGIGIDRLMMLLTDSASIRDVILFPHMRPE